MHTLAISQLILLCLSSALAGLVAKTETCEITAPHITLGDAFELGVSQNTENVFTISLTVTAGCRKLPGVVLRKASATQEASLPAVTLVPFDSKSIDVLIDGVRYRKRGLFFSIDKSHIQNGYSTWEIRRNRGTGSLIHTVERIPPRATISDSKAKVFIIADMDESATAHPTWTQIDQISPDEYDMIMHVGDFAYEIQTNHGKRGDDYFERSSLSGRRIPSLIIGGNHENFADGKLLNYRFKMPAATEETNSMYDFVYKGVYYMFINLDWVLDFNPESYSDHLPRELEMLKWMQSRELLLKDRKDIHWKVFLSHRPFECWDDFCKDCKVNGLIFRRIADQSAKMGFHTMITAHSHTYARHKLVHALQEYPMTKVGNGVYLTVVNGHAGVDHLFNTDKDRPHLWGPFVDRVDVSGPTFLQLELSPELINGKLFRSDTHTVNDQFTLSKEMIAGRQYPSENGFYMLLPTIGAVAIVLAIYLWYREPQSHSVGSDLQVNSGNYELAGSTITGK